jgi:cation transport ATPase
MKEAKMKNQKTGKRQTKWQRLEEEQLRAAQAEEQQSIVVQPEQEYTEIQQEKEGQAKANQAEANQTGDGQAEANQAKAEQAKARQTGEANIKEARAKGKKTVIGVLIGAVVLVLLWNMFPLVFMSIIFDSLIGSNLYLLLLIFGVTALTETAFSNLWHIELPFKVNLIINLILLLGGIFLFSIFFYSPYPWIMGIYFLIAAGIKVGMIGVARDFNPQVKLPLYKRNPFLAIAYGTIFAFTENFLVLLLFVISKNEFVKYL